MASFSTLPMDIADLILQELPRQTLLDFCLVCTGTTAVVQRMLHRWVEISAQRLPLLAAVPQQLADFVHEFAVMDPDRQLCKTTSVNALLAAVLKRFANIQAIRILVTLNPNRGLRLNFPEPFDLHVRLSFHLIIHQNVASHYCPPYVHRAFYHTPQPQGGSLIRYHHHLPLSHADVPSSTERWSETGGVGGLRYTAKVRKEP
ncbi:hypothetical protein B0H10DRAFT_2224549 [Mycena sp. CBHHK59/15]|nr:hypothetical protein B0H10DRAFT_2224549 [Mycena sp. CBHHK59/15]